MYRKILLADDPEGLADAAVLPARAAERARRVEGAVPEAPRHG